MSIKRALNKESSYEISLNLDKKCSRGISYSSQIVLFQSLYYTCFSSAICPLQVPDSGNGKLSEGYMIHFSVNSKLFSKTAQFYHNACAIVMI